MAKKTETMWDKVKSTTDNLIHANSNARAKEEAEKRARRNAIVGGVGIIGVVTMAIIDKLTWKKRLNKALATADISEERAELLQRTIDDLKEKVDNFEEVQND